MTIFEYLLVAHLIGDWMLQTEFQALGKAKNGFFNASLTAHCLSYTLCFVPAIWLTPMHYSWLLLIFSSHMFLDRRWPVIWWIKTIKRTSEDTIKNLFWLVIAVDQVMHILVLAIIAHFTR